MSLVSYSPWGCKESDTTERLLFLSFSLFQGALIWACCFPDLCTFIILGLLLLLLLSYFPGGSDGKVSVYNVGDPGSIPGSGRFPGEGNGNLLQYYCLENPMDGGAW